MSQLTLEENRFKEWPEAFFEKKKGGMCAKLEKLRERIFPRRGLIVLGVISGAMLMSNQTPQIQELAVYTFITTDIVPTVPKIDVKNIVHTAKVPKREYVCVIAVPEELDEDYNFSEFSGEVYLLGQLITCESGSTREDMIAVGSVVLNRARTNYRDFRNVSTIREVIYQGNGRQYSTLGRIKAGVKPSQEALEVAEGLISGEIECLEERILFQNNSKFTGSWAEKLEYVDLPGVCQYYATPKDF